MPVGVVGSETVAVKVTGTPSCDGLAEDDSETDVSFKPFTVYDSDPVDAAKPLPACATNSALSWSVPAGSDEVCNWAVPPLTVTGPPMLAPLTWNWTVPGAAEGETVAVSVTVVPRNCGPFGLAESDVVVGVTGFTVKDAVPVEPL